jgi:hypothetical protein
MAESITVDKISLTNNHRMPYDSRHWWKIRLKRGMGSMRYSFASIVISSVAGLVLTGLPVGSRVR